MIETETLHEQDFALERLVFFSDAVFAIAITLLVLDLHVPHLAAGSTDMDWINALLGMLSGLSGFAIGFLVVGALWASHHTTMSMLTRFHQRLVWPNLLLLMTIAFLPFATGVVSTGTLAHVPFAFYAATLLAASLLKAWLTTRALRPDVVAPTVPAIRVAVQRRRMWVLPIASSITLALAFVAPPWNTLAMLLVPVLLRVPPFAFPRHAGAGQAAQVHVHRVQPGPDAVAAKADAEPVVGGVGQR